MKEYIEREAARELMEQVLGDEWKIQYAIDRLNEIPAADVVEVVRCCECKWWKTNYFWNGTERKVCVIEPYEPCRNPNDFCSRGERKDGADE